MQILVPVASGLEAVVKRQLLKLGYPDTRAQNGRIALEGDWSDIARLNVFLRSGERVLLLIGRFPAQTFDELFDGVYALPWEEYLTPHSQILMDGKSVKSKLGAIKASGAVAKKAIVRRIIDKNRLNTHLLDEKGARSVVGISVFEDIVTVTLDTSGEGLHKRGYRSLSYTAPLKETTAAALIDMTYYFPDKAFADVFCGSGTLPIEAAMRSLNIAPGEKRAFDFEKWRCAPKQAILGAREEAKDLRTLDQKIEVYGSDINPEAIKIAKYHAERAGVGKYIRFCVADMKDFRSDSRYGVLLSNPPYGERLSDEEGVKQLYRDFGRMFRSLPDWNGYIFTGFSGGFERYFGKRADKAKKLFNANIECGFYSYWSSRPQK